MPWHFPSARRVVPVALALPVVVALVACDVPLGHLAGRATEEWTHTYQLSPGGQVRIGNTNGRVDVIGVEGSTVEVRAQKVAHAATDEGARELLPRIKIYEDAKSDRIVVETEHMGGFMIGVGYEVRYDVKVPKNAVLELTTTNGVVSVNNLAGKVNAHTTNGGVRATNLSGAVEARSTNGSVNVDMASVGGERIRLQTTNGSVSLTVPADAKADVSATWTNGGISLSDIKLDQTERSRRSFEGRMNGGGTPIELHTTNGRIRLRNRDSSEASPRTAEPSAR
jgi:hypothetical protein